MASLNRSIQMLLFHYPLYKYMNSDKNMRILARNMTFLMRGIALAREKYGMPEQEKITFTNFVR